MAVDELWEDINMDENHTTFRNFSDSVALRNTRY